MPKPPKPPSPTARHRELATYERVLGLPDGSHLADDTHASADARARKILAAIETKEQQTRDLDRQMGLDTSAPKIGMEGSKQILPLMTREQALAEIKRRHEARR